jgi:hypothetical protein
MGGNMIDLLGIEVPPGLTVCVIPTVCVIRRSVVPDSRWYPTVGGTRRSVVPDGRWYPTVGGTRQSVVPDSPC